MVPAMGDTGVLRVQAAVRTIVSDIAGAQSESLAYQQGRAVRFFPDENRWMTIEIKGGVVDPLNKISEGAITGSVMGDARITAVNFNGGNTLIFDELGGPVTAPGGTTPAGTGTVSVTGSGQEFLIEVQGYTGRVTVRRVGP